MGSSVFSREYALFLTLLRQTREGAGLTQQELSRRLGQTQSFVSKCERGERRVDVIELREFCRALRVPLPVFINTLDQMIRGDGDCGKADD